MADPQTVASRSLRSEPFGSELRAELLRVEDRRDGRGYRMKNGSSKEYSFDLASPMKRDFRFAPTSIKYPISRKGGDYESK